MENYKLNKITAEIDNYYTNYIDLEKEIIKLNQDKINAIKKIEYIKSSANIIPINPLETKESEERLENINKKIKFYQSL